MITVGEILATLHQMAPLELAEEWDNTGLLVGDSSAKVSRVMTCLTITPESAQEAVERRADLVVVHHPLPFRPLKTITAADPTGRMLLTLIEARCAVISLHTAFDSAIDGINELLAARFGFAQARPLIPSSQPIEYADARVPGTGRVAVADKAVPFTELMRRGKTELELATIRYVAGNDHLSKKIAFACGSGGSFLEAAVAAGCDTLVTGEASFHSCLAARAEGVALMLLGHFASERFAMVVLAERIAAAFPAAGLQVWCSETETDPIAAA